MSPTMRLTGASEASGDQVGDFFTEEPRTAPMTTDISQINILIVDDEPTNLTVLETVLDEPGYRLVRATSADEALLALIADEFALLILDISMPGMSGFELAKLIKTRKRTAGVPIIFLTAFYNEDQHELEGYETGAVDYLHKPVNAAVLRSKVAVFADLHRKTRQVEQANRSLLQEVAQRRKAEEALRLLNEKLEERVLERTEALRAHEIRLRDAADAAKLTYVEIDARNDELLAADNFLAVMGFTWPEDPKAGFLKGEDLFLSHVAPVDRARVAAALREFAPGPPVPSFDYQILGDDGIERWIESKWFVRGVADGVADGVARNSFLTNLDVTARKMAEQELRRSDERFRQLADSMPQMVWTAGLDGSIDYYNARWRSFAAFGEGRNGDISNWADILHPEDAERCYEHWRSSIESGDEFQTEYRLWDQRHQQYCWHLGRALLIADKDRNALKWIGTCTDIDLQKRSEEELRRVNSALEQFAFAASHDLQEPLRSVALFTQLLSERYGHHLDEEGHVFMQTIVSGAQRMSHLVTDLLAYTIVSGADENHAAPVDMEIVFARVLENLGRAVQESDATVTHDVLPEVFVPAVHIEQLLQNLIGNAIKYRRDDEAPKIHVTVSGGKDHWHFIVSDNGIGIAPEFHVKVFGVFKRLHATSTKYAGTGMGLAICQKVVEICRGKIWVESTPGEGSQFHFTLPGGPRA